VSQNHDYPCITVSGGPAFVIGCPLILDWEEESGVRSIIRVLTSPAEDFNVAEITKLSVGQALDKLRGADLPTSKLTRLDGKIEELDEEIRRLRAANRRLARDQKAASIERNPGDANAGRVTKLKILVITIGIVMVILILGWMWALWSP
jgi:hypothetical protein